MPMFNRDTKVNMHTRPPATKAPGKFVDCIKCGKHLSRVRRSDCANRAPTCQRCRPELAVKETPGV